MEVAAVAGAEGIPEGPWVVARVLVAVETATGLGRSGSQCLPSALRSGGLTAMDLQSLPRRSDKLR